MKITPGPWEVAGLDRNGQAVVKSKHIEICTCWHHSVGSIEKEMFDNARLIAAAPQLYAQASVLSLLAHSPRFQHMTVAEALEELQRNGCGYDGGEALAKCEGGRKIDRL